MDGRRVVQRLVNGETALEIARSFGYRSLTPVMDAARDFIVAKLGADKVKILRHATSGNVTGEYSSVVGYGAAAILKSAG